MDHKKLADYISPLNMDGLNGRMLRMPSRSKNHKQEILLLCGHHSSIERMGSFVEVFAEYGNITVPDLPGFGGMDSFYKIGSEPTIENYADYLAALIKLRYKSKKVILVGLSFSVPVIVRTLQKYPELRRKVLYVISLSGFVHYQDFKLKPYEMNAVKLLTKFLSLKSISPLSKLLLRRSVVRAAYRIDYLNRKNKKSDFNKIKDRVALDAELWVINDFRTAMFTYYEMFHLDLCQPQPAMSMPIYHFTPEADHYFHKEVVSEHMQVIFKKFQELQSSADVHVPAIDATSQEVKEYLPKTLLKILKSSQAS